MEQFIPFYKSKSQYVYVIGSILLIALLAAALSYWPLSANVWSTFTTVFLGIFIEAMPFLFIGALASGLVEVYVDQDAIQRFTPRSPILSALFGSILGLFFPVCECGVVPLVRRLFHKGFPVPAGIAFLLAAPVINPIVILSTGIAFGFGKVLFMRVGFTILIATIVGLIYTVMPVPTVILKQNVWITSETADLHDHHSEGLIHVRPLTHGEKIKQVFQIALDEFFDIGRYLILGALIAAGLQAFIPQTILMSIGKGPILSVLVMMSLAVLLSICFNRGCICSARFRQYFQYRFGIGLSFYTAQW